MVQFRRYLGAAAFTLLLAASLTTAQDYNQDQDDDYYYADRPGIDRFLDAEVWTDHADADYYTGDDVVILFRTNRDAFVAIYSVDSRGMVNLLFPTDPAEDNFIRGGVTYSLPGPNDDYELVLNGPEGSETIQIIASQERFPIPSWYNNSGLVFDGDDLYDYMDWLNGRHFVRYDGQRFAYDRAVVFVNEWEPSYFRPVYYPDYPSWSVVGNVYVDYPWGSSVYINGYYWGVTPLYIPRILVGWHTLTIYDSYGHCWENDFHVSRYHTSIFDQHTIVTSASVRSKYTRVREAGYRNPVEHGYPNYHEVVKVQKAGVTGGASGTQVKVTTKTRTGDRTETYAAAKKKYVRGEAEIVKTDRGFETRSIATDKKGAYPSKTRSYSPNKSGKSQSGLVESRSGSTSKSPKSSDQSSGSIGSSGKSRTSTSGGYYQKKSGNSSSKGQAKSKTSTGTYKSQPSKSTGSTKSVKPQQSSGATKKKGESSSDKTVKKSPPPKQTTDSKPPAAENKTPKSTTDSPVKKKKR